MVEHDTEEVIQSQRVNEHKNILDMIDMLSKRLRKLEDVVPVTLQTTLEKQDNEHGHILNSIEEILTNQKFIFERLQKLEDKTHSAVGDKALLSKLNIDVEDNRANLYYVQDELGNHCEDAHISQGQVKKWIHELYFGEVKKIEGAKNDKCQG